MGKEEDDQYPDPTKYLFISLEQKRKDQSKPYDGKKMFWIPDDKDCFVLGNVDSEKGDMVTLSIDGGEKVCSVNENIRAHRVMQASQVKLFSATTAAIHIPLYFPFHDSTFATWTGIPDHRKRSRRISCSS